MKKHLALLAAALLALPCFAQESAPAKIDAKAAEVALPAPAKTGGMPLMQNLPPAAAPYRRKLRSRHDERSWPHAVK